MAEPDGYRRSPVADRPLFPLHHWCRDSGTAVVDAEWDRSPTEALLSCLLRLRCKVLDTAVADASVHWEVEVHRSCHQRRQSRDLVMAGLDGWVPSLVEVCRCHHRHRCRARELVEDQEAGEAGAALDRWRATASCRRHRRCKERAMVRAKEEMDEVLVRWPGPGHRSSRRLRRYRLPRTAEAVTDSVPLAEGAVWSRRLLRSEGWRAMAADDRVRLLGWKLADSETERLHRRLVLAAEQAVDSTRVPRDHWRPWMPFRPMRRLRASRQRFRKRLQAKTYRCGC